MVCTSGSIFCLLCVFISLSLALTILRYSYFLKSVPMREKDLNRWFNSHTPELNFCLRPYFTSALIHHWFRPFVNFGNIYSLLTLEMRNNFILNQARPGFIYFLNYAKSWTVFSPTKSFYSSYILSQAAKRSQSF